VDQGQGQLGDLLESPLVTLVFVDPRADLRQQLLGDVDGACLALLLEGELMADVQGSTFGAVTGGVATTSADGAQTGGQERASRATVFEATVQLAADQGGMLGQTHWRLRTKVEACTVSLWVRNGRKKRGARKKAGQAVRRPCRRSETNRGSAAYNRCEETTVPQSCASLWRVLSGCEPRPNLIPL